MWFFPELSQLSKYTPDMNGTPLFYVFLLILIVLLFERHLLKKKSREIQINLQEATADVTSLTAEVIELTKPKAKAKPKRNQKKK